jgi:hypothetical protein
MKSTFLDNLLQKLAIHFTGRKEVVAVYLFGSYARRKADHLSDLDIALLLRPDLPREAMWRLGLRLDVEVCDVLGTDDVDVIVLNTAPLEAQFEVIRTGILLHSNDEGIRTEYEVLMMSAYWDFKKVLDEYDAYALRRIREGMTDVERREYQATLDKIRRMHKTS